MKIITSIVTLFCSVLYLSANQPYVRNFSRKDYKAGAQNWAITQDTNNVMYFANNNGILIYDGKTWNTVPIKNGTKVMSLVYDGKGRFYASTFNEFGYFERNKQGNLEYYSISEPLGVKPESSNEIFYIHQSKNDIYFQGEKNIYRYDEKTLFKLSFHEKIDVSALVNNILFVASQKSGLFMLNGNMFVKIPGSDILRNKKVVALLPYLNNKVLIITAFDGAYLYDGLSITQFITGIEFFLKGNQVFCAVTNLEKIVFGTVQRGIAIQDIATNQVTYVNSFTGLQNNTVLCASFDNQQNLWLGLDKGIDYILLNSSVTNIFGTNNLYGSGYTSLIKSNIIYFGTNQGLYKSAYPLPKGTEPIKLNLIRGMEGQVWCLKEIDNTIFCGDDHGAFIIRSDNVDRIAGVPGTWNFVPLRKHPGKILGCSYQGLFILQKKNNTWLLSNFIKGNFNESSPMFLEDEDGSIWLSHWQKGLYRLFLNNETDSITKVVLYNEGKGFPSNRNNTLFRINKGIIFSSERGFFTHNRKTDKMEPNKIWNNLFANIPSFIRLHESPSGDVWCVSGSFIGLARKQSDNSYSMDSISFRILQPKIIIGFEHFNFIDNHYVIINTEDGFSLIDTRPLKRTDENFKVLVTNVVAVNDKASNPQPRISINRFDTLQKLNSNYNSVRISYNAPEYRNEGLVEYSCKLDNYDQNWSDFSSETSKEYSQLPRGEYTFRVRARDMLELSEAETSFTFVVLPAWYESRLAFIIYYLVAFILVIALVWFVNYRSKLGALKMKELKEKEIEEQKKIFDEERNAKKREIKELKNQQLQYELRHKSQELASSTMNLIRKNEILLEIMDTLNKTAEDIRKNAEPNTIIGRLSKVERNIRENIQSDDNWKKFEENFDLVYENYLKRLGEAYPELNVTDKKICAYIKMDLSSKDMAPLLNMTVRSIETNRYRIRQKLGLDRENNLSDFLQKF